MTGNSPLGRASRREGRESAVELSYEARIRKISIGELIDSLVVPPETFALNLMTAMAEHQEQADQLIAAKAKGWTLERMPVLDLIVMRLAVSEMLNGEAPTGVILSEAVELAGRYSTDESSRFVNGVLAAIARDLPNKVA